MNFIINYSDQPEPLKDIPVEVIHINRTHLRLVFDEEKPSSLFNIYINEKLDENFLFLEAESNTPTTIKITEKKLNNSDENTYRDLYIYVNLVEIKKIEDEKFELRVNFDINDSNKRVIEYRRKLDNTVFPTSENEWKIVSGIENFIENSQLDDQYSFRLVDGTFEIRKNNGDWKYLFSQSVLENKKLASFLNVQYNFFNKVDVLTLMEFNSKALNFSEIQKNQFQNLVQDNFITGWISQKGPELDSDSVVVSDLENYTIVTDIKFNAQNSNIITYIVISSIILVFIVSAFSVFKKTFVNFIRKIDFNISNLKNIEIWKILFFLITTLGALFTTVSFYINMESGNERLLIFFIGFLAFSQYFTLSIIVLIKVKSVIRNEVISNELKIDETKSNKKESYKNKKVKNNNLVNFKIPVSILIDVIGEKDLEDESEKIKYEDTYPYVFDFEDYEEYIKNINQKIPNIENKNNFNKYIDLNKIKKEKKILSNFILVQHINKSKVYNSIQIVVELKNYDVSWLSENARIKFNEIFIQTIKATDIDLKGQLFHMRMINDSLESLKKDDYKPEYAKKILLVLETDCNSNNDFKNLYLIARKLKKELESISLIPKINTHFDNQVFLLSKYYEIEEIIYRLEEFYSQANEGSFITLLKVNNHELVYSSKNEKGIKIRNNENHVLLKTRVSKLNLNKVSTSNDEISDSMNSIQKNSERLGTQVISFFGASEIPFELETDYLYNLCKDSNDTVVISFKKAAHYIDRDFGDYSKSRAKFLNHSLSTKDIVLQKLKSDKESELMQNNYYKFYNINKNNKIIYSIDIIKKNTNKSFIDDLTVLRKYDIKLNLNSSISFQLYKFSQQEMFYQFNKSIDSKFDLLEPNAFGRIPKTLLLFNPINLSTYETVFNHGIFTTNYINDKNGIKLGENKDNKSKVIIDMEKYDTQKNDISGVEATNGHLVILGKSGSGKTYLMESLIFEKSKRNRQLIILDIEDEYNNIDKYLNFKNYEILSSDNKNVEIEGNKVKFLNDGNEDSDVEISVKFQDTSIGNSGEFKYYFTTKVTFDPVQITSSNIILPNENDNKNKIDIEKGKFFDFNIDYLDKANKNYKITSSNFRAKVKDNKVVFPSNFEAGDVDISVKFEDKTEKIEDIKIYSTDIELPMYNNPSLRKDIYYGTEVNLIIETSIKEFTITSSNDDIVQIDNNKITFKKKEKIDKKDKIDKKSKVDEAEVDVDITVKFADRNVGNSGVFKYQFTVIKNQVGAKTINAFGEVKYYFKTNDPKSQKVIISSPQISLPPSNNPSVRKTIGKGTEFNFEIENELSSNIKIDVSTYDYKINPFEVFYRKDQEINHLDAFLNHVNFLKVFLMDMFNIENPKFESHINLLILKTYESKDIKHEKLKTNKSEDENNETQVLENIEFPFICDFVEIVRKTKNDSHSEKIFYSELYESIVNQYDSMEKNANWKRRFDKTEENVRTPDSEKLIKGNLRLVFKGLMQGSTIVKDHRLFLMLIMNILNILIFEREISKGEEKNRNGVFFVVDEAHRYFKKDFLFMIDFLSSIAKQGRKRAIELAVISQNVTDFYRQSDSLDIKQKASDIVKNAAYKFIFQIAQDFEETIDFIQPGDKLTDEELRYIKSLTKGNAYFVQGPYQRTKLLVTRDDILNKK
jgi:hypothetical protein